MANPLEESYRRGSGKASERPKPSTDHENKVSKVATLYLPAQLIGNARGARCGICIMFLKDTTECTILSPAKVDGAKGVCGYYIHGDPKTSDKHPPMRVMPKKDAGYVENGPTHCDNCMYFDGKHTCEIVHGQVEAGGCCNAWESDEEEED